MKIGLSLLCEQPNRKTGLTSLFQNFVREGLASYPDLEFVAFAATGQQFEADRNRVTIRDGYAGNNRLIKRITTEHFKIGPAARKHGCDLVMTTGLVPLITGLPAAMHLLTLHHLGPENKTGGLRTRYRGWATRHGLRKADLVITNTRFAAAQILSVAPEAAPKLLQSYEGIDHAQFHSRRTSEEELFLRTRFGIEPGYFFWCSNFYPYKQAELMMEAWCELPKDVRERVPMVMVGGGGWGDSKAKTLAIAERKGAAGQVKMLGWVTDEEIPVLFRHAAVFVHPSREETFGRSVLEAMASGVPCVVQEIPVMREVTNRNALLIDYNNRESAVEALREALENETTRERLIRGGIERAGEFSFERLAVERIEGLRQVMGLPPGNPPRMHAPVFADSFA